MSKVKQWAEDTAEKSVDLILKKLKEGQINLENATTNILVTVVSLLSTPCLKPKMILSTFFSAVSSAHCFTFDIL